MLLLTCEIKVIVSLLLLPIIVVPLKLTSCTTFSVPVIVTLDVDVISLLAAVNVTPPVVLSIVLPLILILPVSTFVGSIIVVFTPSVNVTPAGLVIVRLLGLKVIVPSF